MLCIFAKLFLKCNIMYVPADNLPVLVHKVLVELDNRPDPLGTGRKECRTEMQRSILLSEATAGNNTHTGGIEHLEAVQLVGGPAFLLGGLDSLGWQGDGREQVHATLGLAALDTLHLLKGAPQGVRALLEAVEDTVVFLLVKRVGRLAFLGWVDHELNKALTNNGCTQRYRDKLVNLGLNLGVKVDQLKVSATVTALTDHALGDRVQRGKLETVVLAIRVLLLQGQQDLAEGDELANENVGLVHLVGHDHKLFLAGILEDIADIGFGEGGAGRIARVNDHNSANIDTICLGVGAGLLDGGEIGTPALGLVEVVGHAGSVQDGQGGGVERVLGNRDEDAGLFVGANDVQKRVDARGGTTGEVDVGLAGGEAITSCWKVGVSILRLREGVIRGSNTHARESRRCFGE